MLLCGGEPGGLYPGGAIYREYAHFIAANIVKNITNKFNLLIYL